MLQGELLACRKECALGGVEGRETVCDRRLPCFGSREGKES